MSATEFLVTVNQLMFMYFQLPTAVKMANLLSNGQNIQSYHCQGQPSKILIIFDTHLMLEKIANDNCLNDEYLLLNHHKEGVYIVCCKISSA